jgi:hypothetical protein
MVLPDDLRTGVEAVATDTGYTADQVLRFMLEEEIGWASPKDERRKRKS